MYKNKKNSVKMYILIYFSKNTVSYCPIIFKFLNTLICGVFKHLNIVNYYMFVKSCYRSFNYFTDQVITTQKQ